jgi:hypothetical protein
VNQGRGRFRLRDSPDAGRGRADDAFGVTSRLEIELPSRASAFLLEDHLKPRRPLAVGRHGVWHVELDVEDGELDAVLISTRDWLETHDETAVVSLRR